MGLLSPSTAAGLVADNKLRSTASTLRAAAVTYFIVSSLAVYASSLFCLFLHRLDGQVGLRKLLVLLASPQFRRAWRVLCRLGGGVACLHLRSLSGYWLVC